MKTEARFQLRLEKDGTKVPSPTKTETKVSPPTNSEIKALPPKQYSHLPHIDLVGHYQFITFRTYDSIDEFLRKWDFSPALSNQQKQLKIDEHLDNSINGAYLDNEVLLYMCNFLIAQDKKLYNLIAFTIMPNHIHILCKPLQKLSQMMQAIKGKSAFEINKILNKNGKFWANDYYDKAIRDEKHFFITYEYIKNNVLKLGEAKASLPRFYGVYDE